MKIGLQTWGSYGDIRPFLALAVGLQSDGHEVTLVVTAIDAASYDSSISRSGVDIQIVSSPVIQDKEALRIIEADIFAEPDPLKQTQAIIEKLFVPVESNMYEAALHLCKENDLVIGHFFHYPLNVAAEKTGCAYASVALVHSAIPSSLYPPSGMPNLGSLGNRAMWSLAKSVLNKKLKKYPDRLREQHGLRPARDLVSDIWASKQLTLVAVSPQICGFENDWPEYYQVCGFLNMQEETFEGGISDDLLSFLSQGEPPVYMTFGSAMSGGDQSATIAILTNAAKRASGRAVIQAPGWRESGLSSSTTTHYVDNVPHSKVFPHCQSIVHHGGAGTSQAALLAGKPSILVTHTSEQEFWGRELARIGVAPKPLSRKNLSADHLARSIELVAKSNSFSQAARKAGNEMAKENGVATAVSLINKKFSA